MTNPGLLRATNETVVSIFVDGDKRVVSTSAATVGDVLARAQVDIGLDDLVEPARNTLFTSEIFNINVYRARPVVVIDGASQVRVNSPYQNPKLIAERSAKLTVYPEDEYQTELIQDFLQTGSVGTKITIKRAVPVTVKVDGITLPIRTQQKTVGDALKDKGIVLSAEDQINLPTQTPISPNLEIAITRIGHQVVAQEETIPFSIETVFDNNQLVGYEQVKQEGADGKKLVTYEIISGNGAELDRKVLQTVVEIPALSKIIVRGSKTIVLSEDFVRLRQCESGGNYAANTGNGFYGAYQFSLGTWGTMGTGYSRPDLAPPPVQDDAARRLQQRAGWGQWPSCAARLGLR